MTRQREEQTRLADAELEVSVADTGPGIPEADLAQIWERFWQGEGRGGKGVGLGLTIAKGLVEAHGGRIWAESKVGVGTTFYFTLPLEQARASNLGQKWPEGLPAQIS